MARPLSVGRIACGVPQPYRKRGARSNVNCGVSIDLGQVRALAHFRCSLSGCSEHTLAKEVELRAAVHLALEALTFPALQRVESLIQPAEGIVSLFRAGRGQDRDLRRRRPQRSRLRAVPGSGA